MKKNAVRYTLLFFPTLIIICLPFILRGEVFVYSGDGVSQHLTFMRYYSQWLRDSFSALTHGRLIQLYSHSMGYGSDILAALNWYGMGDPLCLLYGLFPADHILIGFTAISLLRTYLAGLAFVAMANRFGSIGRRFVPVSGICYAFGAFAFSLGLLRHPFFINPLIQLPLLLIGIDKLFNDESPVPFLLAVAWTALCGYYFLYMCCIFLFLFAVVRFIYLKGRNTLRELPAALGKCLLFFFIGLGIAAPVFFPAFIGFLHSGRSGDVFGVSTADELSLQYLFKLPYDSLAKLSQGTCQPALLWLGFIAALFRRDRQRALRVALAVCALILVALPFTDYMMNGFAFSTTRWTFGLSALIVFEGAAGLGSLQRLTKRRRILIYGFSAVGMLYFAYFAIVPVVRHRHSINLDVLESAAYPALVALSFLVAAAAIWWIHRPAFQGRPQVKARASRLIAVVLVANVVVTGYLWAVPRVITDTYRTPKQLSALYSNSPLLSLYSDRGASDGFIRVDADASAMTHHNDCVTAGISSTIFYNSTLPSSVCNGVADMNLPIVMCNRLCGLNGHSSLEALWSITDYVRVKDDSNQPPVPYGFTKHSENDLYELYLNDNPLPFGYTTRAYVTRDEFNSASAEERQWMLLQSATLPSEDSQFEHIEPKYDYVAPEVSLEYSDDVEWTDGRLVAGKNGWLRLTYEGVDDSEVYIKLQGLEFEQYGDNKVTWRISNGASGYIDTLSTPAFNQLYPDQRDFLVNVGYSESAQNEVTITFNERFEARLDGLSVVCQPMTEYKAYLQALRSEGMEDVAFDTNRITGTCDVSAPSILVMSLPYAKGWRARIDGQKAELFESGGGLSALKLSPGKHDIELTYRSPGMTAGMIAFLGALLLLAVAGISTLRRRKQRS